MSQFKVGDLVKVNHTCPRQTNCFYSKETIGRIYLESPRLKGMLRVVFRVGRCSFFSGQLELVPEAERPFWELRLPKEP